VKGESIVFKYRFRARVTLAMLATMWGLALAPASAGVAVPNEQGRHALLTEPGVLFVYTSFSVKVGIRFNIGDDWIERQYKQPYSSGSGFVVTPTGTLVTAGHVVELDRSAIRRYAANRLLLVEFARAMRVRPLGESDDLYTQYKVNDSGGNRILKGCYDADFCRFSIQASYHVLPAVQIAGSVTSKPLVARLLYARKSSDTDIAVLDIEGANIPTVPIAETATHLQSGDDVVALGFPGSELSFPKGLTEPSKAFGKVSNVRQGAGATDDIQADIAIEGGMSGGPVIDDAGRVVGLISYTGVNDRGGRAQAHIRTVDDIRAALASVGAVPARGPVDEQFAHAMELYWQSHHSAALPLLQQTLNLSDGHPLAKRYLALAQSKVGTPEDVPVPTKAAARKHSSTSAVLSVAGGAVAAAMLALFAGSLLVRRRAARRRQAIEGGWTPAEGARAELAGAGRALPVPLSARRGAGAQDPASARAPFEGNLRSETTATGIACSDCGADNGRDRWACHRCGVPLPANKALMDDQSLQDDGEGALHVPDSVILPDAGAVPAPSPDWYPDPTGRHAYRYWDGVNWTDDVAADGVVASDPLSEAQFQR
jgi:S1-C subfamily serine protease